MPGRKIAEGWTSELFRLEDGRVLKVYKPHFAAVRDGEFEKMRLLAGRYERMPRLYEKREVDGRSAYVMDHVDGPSLCRASGGMGSPEEIAGPLFELFLGLRKVAAPEGFETLHERLRMRLADHPALGEELRAAALRELDGLEIGNGLCHGDFHPGNVILSPDGPVLIDWNGASRGDFHGDLAKTLLLLRHAPEGLALAGKGYEGRVGICRAYLDLFGERGFFEECRLARWLYVRGCEFLTFPLPEFERGLSGVVADWLAGGCIDPQEFLAV